MLVHPQFDPVALHLGSFGIRWYGLMYLLGFACFIWLGRLRLRSTLPMPSPQSSDETTGETTSHLTKAASCQVIGYSHSTKPTSGQVAGYPAHPPRRWRAEYKSGRGSEREKQSSTPDKLLDDLLFCGVLGVVLGGRLGEVLFYNPGYYFAHPAKILAVWEGGMSFHGGFLGVLIAMVIFARSRKLVWLQLMDFIAPLVPLGLGAGRIGNFINAELWGRPTDLPWGMVFPNVDQLPRHPSQLYEFALEGMALFALLWLFSSKPRPAGAVSGLFLIGYGSFRFIGEFARTPDDGIFGLMTFGISMGQWLSLPMVLAGIAMMVWAYKHK